MPPYSLRGAQPCALRRFAPGGWGVLGAGLWTELVGCDSIFGGRRYRRGVAPGMAYTPQFDRRGMEWR